ncbi:uncharacterized protein M421DRAFT_346054 [Didymella exigua CBS 183.55]|uniref:Nagb/rpia/CoA transferase-like protein n=1 Tax=Didymella exigua CBS 183.55 TaxID=1150837 RepID=A0A6A5RV43_9PLEO|nr:uncharacterized protein M421DRAFT_346054 [Didymella exigua CBS 183.55]KAF1931373.1 hypothetical protein M421DRAFT_346054 [Didymella exigua CBS 183.55]
MLELAIAEAYRPRPRPQQPPAAPPRLATFATNPNARASVSSLRSQSPSLPSRRPSVVSHAFSLRSWVPRRTRLGSISSGRTVTPHDATRADSIFSQATVKPTSRAIQDVERCAQDSPVPRQPIVTPAPHALSSSEVYEQELPPLPPPVPLPPQEELEHFDTALQECLEALQPPSSCLNRDLAGTALEHLSHIADLASCIATSWPEFFTMLLHAVKLMASVLPTHEVGARNVLVRSLAGVVKRWNEKRRRGTAEIPMVIGEVFDNLVQARKMENERLGEKFGRWLCGAWGNVKRTEGKMLRILTLSVSTAVLAALKYALTADQDLEIHLSVLTSLDKGLPLPPAYPRLRVTTYPSTTIGTASQGVDVLLLEPDSIGHDGDVQCQNGALGTAVCVRALSPTARVVVLSGADNVASSAIKGRAATEAIGGIEETPELVSAEFVDVYATDVGFLKAEDFDRMAVEVAELDQRILR